MNWDDLRFFLEVHRHGSHAAAGRILSVNPTTVARRIAALEHQLDIKLFRRTPDGHELTEEGAQIIQAVEDMELNAHAVERSLDGETSQVGGRVRLTASGEMLSEYLIEVLAPLLKREPQLEIEYATGRRYFDLARGEADLAVRFGPADAGVPGPTPGVLVARRVGMIRLAPYASADYLERHDRPELDETMSGHVLVGRSEGAVMLPGAPWLATASKWATTGARCDSFLSTRSAVAAGLGIGVMPIFIARAKSLVRIGPPISSEDTAIWLVVHEDIKNTPRVRAVMDEIISVMQRDREWFQGTDSSV